MLYVQFLLSAVLSASLTLGGESTSSLPGAQGPAIQLTELHEELAIFEDQERYDYIEDDFQYTVLDKEDFDGVFHRSALLAARLHQVRETSDRYKEGYFDTDAQEDIDFLAVMSAVAFDALPNMVGEAQGLLAQLPTLDMGGIPILKKVRAIQGMNQARQNIQSVLVLSADDVDSVLDDYKALQADLDMMEAAEESEEEQD